MLLVVALFGLIWLVKGEIDVPGNRRINANTGRMLGAAMFIGSIVLSFVPFSDVIPVLALLIAVLPILVGIVASEEKA